MNKSLLEPDKGRLIATLRGEIPDRVPHAEGAYESRITSYVMQKPMGSSFAASRGVQGGVFSPPWEPEDAIEFCRRISSDYVSISAAWVPIKYRDESGKLGIINDGRIKSHDDLDRAILPNWEDDYAPRLKYLKRYREALKGSNIGLSIDGGSIFQSAYQFLVGFEDFFTLLYTDQDFCERLLDISTEYYLRVIEMALEVGVDLVGLGDDIAFRNGPFVNPELLKKLWFPRQKKLVDLAKSAGLPVQFHSCGNVNRILDDIILPLGVDGVNPIEPYAMDIFDIKRRYGHRVAIQGNIDIAGPLATGTPEDVVKLVREYLERLMPGGRYILGSSHSITDDIPPENFMAMINTCHQYGVYR